MNNSNQPSPLHVEVISNASATTLFDAWTMPAIAELWLFQSSKNEVNFIADVKEGGEFNIIEKSSNHAISHWGNYIKIDRPRSLLFSLAVPDHFAGISEVSVEIKEDRGGCKLALSQKNVDTSKNVEAWSSMLTSLRLNQQEASQSVINDVAIKYRTDLKIATNEQVLPTSGN